MTRIAPSVGYERTSTEENDENLFEVSMIQRYLEKKQHTGRQFVHCPCPGEIHHIGLGKFT